MPWWAGGRPLVDTFQLLLFSAHLVNLRNKLKANCLATSTPVLLTEKCVCTIERLYTEWTRKDRKGDGVFLRSEN